MFEQWLPFQRQGRLTWADRPTWASIQYPHHPGKQRLFLVFGVLLTKILPIQLRHKVASCLMHLVSISSTEERGVFVLPMILFLLILCTGAFVDTPSMFHILFFIILFWQSLKLIIYNIVFLIYAHLYPFHDISLQLLLDCSVPYHSFPLFSPDDDVFYHCLL